MEIFAQEFEPASYFWDLTCVHLIVSIQKLGPISGNELLQKIKLSKNIFIVSCSPNLMILTETKIKIIKLTFDIENWL
jgi:hypothetical protein